MFVTGNKQHLVKRQVGDAYIDKESVEGKVATADFFKRLVDEIKQE